MVMTLSVLFYYRVTHCLCPFLRKVPFMLLFVIFVIGLVRLLGRLQSVDEVIWIFLLIVEEPGKNPFLFLLWLRTTPCKVLASEILCFHLCVYQLKWVMYDCLHQASIFNCLRQACIPHHLYSQPNDRVYTGFWLSI